MKKLTLNKSNQMKQSNSKFFKLFKKEIAPIITANTKFDSRLSIIKFCTE